MARLGRTGRLADDFFLMVHDDLSGRPRLSERLLGLGLAGALLGELAIVRAIGVEDGDVTVTAWEPPQFTLLGDVFREIEAEQRRPVRDWLDYLGHQATDRVARRLEAEGLVYLKPPRIKLPGRAGQWTPVDANTAKWPAIDVKLQIHNNKADAHTLMLFGLTRATGLNNDSLWEVRYRLDDPAVLEETLEPLGQSPPLLDLLAHTEAAVGSAVTSQRIG